MRYINAECKGVSFEFGVQKYQKNANLIPDLNGSLCMRMYLYFVMRANKY